jgi:F0F1-type ATP synthase membrane subunit b/b'
MWALAWLRNSANRDRREIGEKIFKEAQNMLTKKKEMKMQELLGASKSLVEHLIQLAK